jgi:hypothetical protein
MAGKPQSGFGKMLNLAGKAWAGLSTAVPLPILQQMAKNSAIPISTSTLTVSIAGSVTHPVPLWIGNDFTEVKEAVDYTIIPGTNTNFINSDGEVEAAQVTAATVYYMYAGLDSAGAVQFYPSASFPKSVQGPNESSNIWSHPGTSRDKYWAYCGFFQATTTVPAIAQLTKRGFIYSNPVPTAMGVIEVAKDTTIPASEDFSTLVPKHGVQCWGWGSGATDAAGSDSFIGSDSLAAQQFAISTNSLHVTAPPLVNFGPVIPDTSGLLWAMSAVTNATGAKANITTIKDVV